MHKFNITGMSCASCSARVENAVSKVDGVESCVVNLLSGSMSVKGTVSDEEIIKAVQKAGYGATVQTELEIKNNNLEITSLKRRLVFSLFFLICLLYLTMGHSMLGIPLLPFLSKNYSFIFFLQPILAAIVIFINKKLFINGIKSLIKFNPNMDSLVALGTGTSYIYSIFILIDFFTSIKNNNYIADSTCENLYFEGTVMVLTLITFGKFLETISKGKTTNAINSLIRLVPDFANILKNQKEINVPASKVKVNDIVVVRAGQRIPIDGIIIEGNCCIDEGTFTGESIPVEKTIKDQVFASTFCLDGFIKIRTEKVGQDTGVSKIINHVLQSSQEKAPIQRIADKVSSIFIPVVLLISLLTFVVWFLFYKDLVFAINRAVSVLVISCPCALGLATPVAIMVGFGIGAKNGILFKTSASLESTGQIKIVAFDKTGTLTKGIPEVTDIEPLQDITKDKLLLLAAATESASSHSFAKAILKKANGLKIPKVQDFKNITSSGVVSLVDKEKIFCGNFSFISSVCKEKIDIKKIELFANQGKTPLLVSTEKNILGIIALSDLLKEDAIEAIKELKRMKIKVAMITGDNKITANTIASEAGIKTVFAEVHPEKKSEIIKDLKKEFGYIAMVGDGINDAVALTTADTGIAIGAGTDVAIDSANIILVNNKINDVVNAIKLSRRIMNIIHQNLFFAFFYNVLLIPLAAGCFFNFFGWTLNPMICAVCMSLSSFCVVTNALRLNLYKINKKFIIKNRNKNIFLETNKMEKIIDVEGMMCPNCEAHVKKALEKISGIIEAKADFKTSKVIIKFSAEVDFYIIKNAIEDEGYVVKNL